MRRRFRHQTLTGAAVALGSVGLMGTPLLAAADQHSKLASKPDSSYVSLTGTVVTSGEGQFALDYGDDIIIVEMDDWAPADDALFIDPGDRVTVDGRVDDGFYEARTIEASRVFSYDRSTYYYASAADEEGDMFSHPVFSRPVTPDQASEGSWVSMTGTVTAVDGREFRLRSGSTTMEVDTSDMAYNPLDDLGHQQVDVGDEVSVVGEIDNSIFDDREIDAMRLYSVVGSAS